MEAHILDIITKLGLALLIGTVIGTEREFKNKSAGLRTLILICVGSALFTMLSPVIGAEGETGRIASNIVTGIGFLGAGAILREGLTVSGLTTASSVWVTAALGMAVGAGNYELSIFATIVVLAVLTLFGFIQPAIERYKKVIEIHITFSSNTASVRNVEAEMDRLKLKFEVIRTFKKDGDSVFLYEVSGPLKKLNLFLTSLHGNVLVKAFHY